MSLRERKEWWGGGGGSGSAECLLPSLLGQESQVPAGAHTPGTFKRDRVKRGRGGGSLRGGDSQACLTLKVIGNCWVGRLGD